MVLSIFLLSVFVAALTVGALGYRSSAWHFVDLVYYPLAAIGVALLFANTTTQRQSLELAQAEQASKTALATHLRAVPNVSVTISPELVDASIKLVATIPEFAKACRYPGNTAPRCLVAEKLAPALNEFLAVAGRQGERALAERLANTCQASDSMILRLKSAGHMSSLVADELVTQYQSAIAKQLPQFSFDPLLVESQAFESRASASLRRVSSALGDQIPGIGPVLAAYGHEIEFGKIMLQGLLPCITVPRNGLEAINAWTRKKLTQEAEVAALRADSERLAAAGPTFPSLTRLHLYIWPYILIAALALKFAKGVAAVRKHRKT